MPRCSPLHADALAGIMHVRDVDGAHLSNSVDDEQSTSERRRRPHNRTAKARGKAHERAARFNARIAEETLQASFDLPHTLQLTGSAARGKGAARNGNDVKQRTTEHAADFYSGCEQHALNHVQSDATGGSVADDRNLKVKALQIASSDSCCEQHALNHVRSDATGGSAADVRNREILMLQQMLSQVQQMMSHVQLRLEQLQR